jgi:hypothetical protein
MATDIPELPRSRQARAAAEQALRRVVQNYGSRPDFVLLGGLVPDLLCARSHFQHARTTDIDVQVDLEISTGSTNAIRRTTGSPCTLEGTDVAPGRAGLRGGAP